MPSCSHVPNRHTAFLHITRFLVAASLLACTASPVMSIALAQDENTAGTENPSYAPPVAWMLKPAPLPDAVAGSDTEMKSYKEQIPGSDVSFDMIPIPGGTFLMGSPADESDRMEDEGPQFQVQLEPFWMGKCEVTWEEYELWAMGIDRQFREITRTPSTEYDRLADAVAMPTKPYADMSFGMGKHGYPAICMTQLAAKIYCKWLSAKTGRFYRLPTEAEWEYACRAGTTTAYSFGDDPDLLEQYAWYWDNSDDKYQKVGQKKPNPWGLYDMHGNVSEWVLDQFTPDGYTERTARAVKNPLAEPAKIYPRVVRGGSWMDDPDMLRSARRLGSTADWKKQDPQIPQSIWYHTDADFVGFRIVRPLRTPPPGEAARYDVDAVQQSDMKEYIEIRGQEQ
jgi:formylglycine-generating enzyme required for sulfatase activity